GAGARVFGENVDGTKRAQARRDHLLDLVRIAKVRAAVHRANSMLVLDLRSDGVNATGIGKAVQDDVTASCGKALRGRESEALDRPGDESASALQRFDTAHLNRKIGRAH